jgi:hypothetical protein
MARRTHVRRCVGVRGDGTAECRARSRAGEAGLSPSVACVRVCAERRRHGHGGDTKLMACTRQVNRERGTARNGPAALVRHIHRRTNSRARGCTCTGSARKNRAPARWWCARAKRRWHSRGDGTTLTTCARQKVCADTTPGQRKVGPQLDGGVLSVWVQAANRSSATHVEQRNDTTARQRSARGDDGSSTCKATGLARWLAIKRRRVCAVARGGTAVKVRHR